MTHEVELTIAVDFFCFDFAALSFIFLFFFESHRQEYKIIVSNNNKLKLMSSSVVELKMVTQVFRETIHG